MTLLNNPFVTSITSLPNISVIGEETEELLRWLVNENNVVSSLPAVWENR